MTLEEGGELGRFLGCWNARKTALESQIAALKSPEEIPKARQAFSELHKFYNDSTLFLRSYDKKICQTALNDLQSRIADLDVKLHPPKRKFGFKTRLNVPVQPSNELKLPSKKIPTALSDSFLGLVLQQKTSETIELSENEIIGRDVLLSGINKCEIKIFGSPATLHMADIKNSTVFCGPVASSVFVERACESHFQVACQQLRVHESVKLELRIHVQSRPIIEDSREIKFGVYKFHYEGVDKDYCKAGLDQGRNLWRNVDDFNWLNAAVPSPNFSFIEEEASEDG